MPVIEIRVGDQFDFGGRVAVLADVRDDRAFVVWDDGEGVNLDQEARCVRMRNSRASRKWLDGKDKTPSIEG